MSIRFTRLILRADDDELALLCPGYITDMEQLYKIPAAAEFCRDYGEADAAEVIAEHYRYGDEGPEYDADQNHLMLIAAYNEQADEMGTLPFLETPAVDFMREHTFEVRYFDALQE